MNLKKALTFLAWPIFVVPTLIEWFGMALNEAAVWANHLQMPYALNSCKVREAIDFLNSLSKAPKMIPSVDPVHVCMDHATHLKILSDIIITSGGVYSIGDMILQAGFDFKEIALYVWVALMVYCAWTKRKPYME